MSPLVVLIPGGFGLSIKTLKGLELLGNKFDLVYVNPPGTGGIRGPRTVTYESFLRQLETQLKKYRRPVILLGHSYGGVQAVELAVRRKIDVVGVVCLASPLSQSSMTSCLKQYKKHRTDDLKAAESMWIRNKTDENLRKWFLSYKTLWFRKDTLKKGISLIQKDKLSAKTFNGITQKPFLKPGLIRKLSTLSVPKILIAGQGDLLFLPNTLKRDAKKANMKFFIIRKAGHFVALDQPKAVTRLIEKEFCDGTRSYQ